MLNIGTFHMGKGEFKLVHGFPRQMQSLFSALALTS